MSYRQVWHKKMEFWGYVVERSKCIQIQFRSGTDVTLPPEQISGVQLLIAMPGHGY